MILYYHLVVFSGLYILLFLSFWVISFSFYKLWEKIRQNNNNIFALSGGFWGMFSVAASEKCRSWNMLHGVQIHNIFLFASISLKSPKTPSMSEP